MNHAHIPDLPWIQQRSPAGKFESFCRNVSLAIGGIRNTGVWGGGHPFDVQIRRIPPGASVCPFHAHFAQWEFFLVQAGEGTVRAGVESHAVRAGDFFIHPPGEAHQLTNSGTMDLEVLIVADNPPLDAFFYPDSNKWGLRPPGTYFRLSEVDYFDGEEPAGETGPGFKPSPPPATPAITPFVHRKRHLDDVLVEAWESPKGKFRGRSKELSIALGAERNTPTGLGGHPFEVELTTIGPGDSPCPFHSHATQWELYLIEKGTAAIRAGDATRTFGPGDVWIHPPFEPHQLRNASTTEDLCLYVVADCPAADYWHYPDSNKWGLRRPRMFFRTREVEYYDDEE